MHSLVRWLLKASFTSGNSSETTASRQLSHFRWSSGFKLAGCAMCGRMECSACRQQVGVHGQGVLQLGGEVIRGRGSGASADRATPAGSAPAPPGRQPPW